MKLDREKKVAVIDRNHFHSFSLETNNIATKEAYTKSLLPLPSAFCLNS